MTTRLLTWRNTNLTLLKTKQPKNGTEEDGTTGPDRKNKLLQNMWGSAQAGKVTAILGPSEAGLNILAGRYSSSKKWTVEADVSLNGQPVQPQDLKPSFVAQDDSLLATATPREAIRFSARLRLSRTTAPREIDDVTYQMQLRFGLVACADTMSGNAQNKGISGGEKKQTAVAVEWVTYPSIILLNEPLPGLDSFQAAKLVQLLHKVAENHGTTVLMAVHQPSSDTFLALDQVIFLATGRVLYQGEPTMIPNFLEEHGQQPSLEHTNPADWMLLVAQTTTENELDKADLFMTYDTFQRGASRHDHNQPSIVVAGGLSTPSVKDVDALTPGMTTQVRLLIARELVHYRRNIQAFVIRFASSIFLGLLIGIIYKDVGRTDSADAINL